MTGQDSNATRRVIRQGGGCRVIVRSKTPGMVIQRPGNVAYFSAGVAPITKAAA